nr:DNA alkylation repair protein [Bacteroidota bacterium]
MSEFVNDLRQTFNENANPELAKRSKAYLRDQFDFFGIRAPRQKEIRKEFLKTHQLDGVIELALIIKELWEQPEREFQHFGLFLPEKYKKKIDAEFMGMIEYMVTTKSWWDTVDFIAPHLVGTLFKQYPALISTYTNKWLASGNMW